MVFFFERDCSFTVKMKSNGENLFLLFEFVFQFHFFFLFFFPFRKSNQKNFKPKKKAFLPELTMTSPLNLRDVSFSNPFSFI